MSIETIKARADAATPGPWSTVGTERRVVVSVAEPVAAFTITDDAALIAHARQDIPALLRVAEAAAAAVMASHIRGYWSSGEMEELGAALRDVEALP